MLLYDYVFFVVTKLLGGFGNVALTIPGGSTFYMRYPLLPRNISTTIGDISIASDTFTLGRSFSYIAEGDLSTLNSILSNPVILMSYFVYIACMFFTIELCLILPFRWLKRLVRYPNHRLETPQEARRRRGK